MKKQYLSLVALFMILFGNASAQIVGVNCYLQGTFTECGIARNGSLGPSAPPPGYHPNGPGTNLAMVYDWGHDGWAVGTPPFYGDYTYPGTPFEGWAMQVNGARSDGWFSQNPANIANLNAGVSALTGANTGYSVVGGVATGVWTGTTTGTSGGLNVVSTSRIEPNGSWIIFTVEFTNTTGTPIPDVYFWRTCDPDNAQTRNGSFSTTNTVVYQNDVAHRVMVSSVGASPTTPNAYLALGTKDCRAKAFCYQNWATYPSTAAGNSLDRIWNQTAAATLGNPVYNQGGTQTGDYAIGLVYNLGTINPGATAVLSYAYIFNNNNGIDEAFPEPRLFVNGIGQNPTGPAPAPTIDTIDICGLNLASFPVRIDSATDKNWTGSTWTWSPSTGLSSTTGVNVTINTSVLPSVITYTITGNDSNINMMSCNYRTMYLTVLTCGANVNDPCLGDTLKFNVPGDSTNVSYQWYGPGPGFGGGVIDTNQGFYIFPTTWADSGLYHVIKIRGTVADTYQVTAIIHPLPTLNLSSSIPLCGDINDSLQLGVLPTVTGTTYLWSGPNGFTSNQQFPLITPFDSSGEGIYYVYGTTSFGCKDTNSITVYMGITPGFDYVVNRGCLADSVYVYNSSVNALTYSWDFGHGAGATTRDAMHVYPSAKAPDGIWTITLNMTNAHCTKSVSHEVNTRHTVTADFSTDKDIICFTRDAETIIFTNNSSATIDTGKVAPFATVPGEVIGYSWQFGFPGATSTDMVPTMPTYPAAGVYSVTLVVTDSIGCKATITKPVTLLQVDVYGFDDTTLCLRQPMYMDNTVTLFPPISGLFDYSWTESPVQNLSATNIQHPYLTGFGVFTDVLRATIQPWGCYGEKTFVIHSVLGQVLQNVTPSTTISYGTSIQLNAENEVYYHWVPNDGSVDNPNINNPNAAPVQTTTYTVFGMDQYGCVDSAFVTIIVDSTLNESIPSAFTPNGDGLNDVFRPIGLKYQRLVDFRIFNRWGQVIFETANAGQGWDGTLNGVPQDLGVYHYHVIVAKPDGTNKIYKGDVTLIR